MTKDITAIFELIDSCAFACQTLKESLDNEKKALIEFQMDALLENNQKKEMALTAVIERRERMDRWLQAELGSKDLAAMDPLLAEPALSQWKVKRLEWKRLWESTKLKCKENQNFIQHSLKNLSLFAEQLKKLFSVNNTYSNKGTQVEPTREGKVVEAEY